MDQLTHREEPIWTNLEIIYSTVTTPSVYPSTVDQLTQSEEPISTS